MILRLYRTYFMDHKFINTTKELSNEDKIKLADYILNEDVLRIDKVIEVNIMNNKIMVPELDMVRILINHKRTK